MKEFFALFSKSIIFGMIGGLAVLLLAEWIFPFLAVPPRTDRDIKVQLSKLDEIQVTLKELQGFVAIQKEKLKSDRKSLEDIQKEREKLEPVVNANRRAIQSILDFQQDRFQSQVWKERAIGFAIGFLSSLLASFAVIWGNRNKALRVSKDESAKAKPEL